MNDLLGVTLEELLTALKRKKAPLPFEIGAFVALETTSALMASGPAMVSATDVRVGNDGVVSVFAPPHTATAEQATRAVVALLAQLLVAAGPGVPTTLLRIIEAGPSGGFALERLRADLEATLVPLNRPASRRVLARLLREASRQVTRAGMGGAASPAQTDRVDADLDALLGDGGDLPEPEGAATEPGTLDAPDLAMPTPMERLPWAPTFEPEPPVPPESAERASYPTPMKPPPFDLPAARPPAHEPNRDSGPGVTREPAASPAPPPTPVFVPTPAPVSEVGRALTPTPMPAPRAPLPAYDVGSDALDTFVVPKPRRGGLALFALAALTALFVAVVVVTRPDVVDRLLGRRGAEQTQAAHREAEARAARERAAREHADRFGEMVVHAAPDRSQIFMYVGRGPVVVENLPTGVAHEFVAVADGRAPTRAVVPKDAQWERSATGPRYELAMQTSDEPVHGDEIEFGQSRLPQDMGTPSQTLGSIRVVTTPPRAKVYLLIGFAPETRVENMRRDQALELIVYHPERRSERIVVGPSDWTVRDGHPIAEMHADLEERD